MEDKESTESWICTGSHLNQRVFNPEDPWLSLESTIVAGNVTLDVENSSLNSKNNDLSTVAEDKTRERVGSEELEPIVDDNVLNMNIDAISDDEVFFDCTTSPRPTPKKFFNSRNNFSPKSPRQKIKRNATPRYGQFLLVDDCPSTSSSGMTEASSSCVETGQRTGGLLVQIVDNFNDIKYHAHSTPLLEESSDSGYFQLPELVKFDDTKCSSPRERSKSPAARQRASASPRKKSSGRKSPTYKPMSPVDPSNKENYYRGKYSRAVTDRLKAAPHRSHAPLRQRQAYVAQMKQFFESRILNENQPSLKPAQSSSIHYKTTLRKSPRISETRSFKSEAEASRKKRSARSRPSSCSDISSTGLSASRSNRSKSTSDAFTDNSIDKIKVQRLNNDAIKRYKLVNQRPTLFINSAKDSTIKKRRSFGLVVSPIKPVREIRKMFSPTYQNLVKFPY